MKAVFVLCALALAVLAACSGSTGDTEPAPQPAAAPERQSDTQATPVPASGQTSAPVPGSGQGGGGGGGAGGGAGPGSGPAAAAVPTGPNVVTVILPNQHNLQWMNFWIALGAGYFADEGLEVYPISPPRPDRAGRFLMMGRGDVAILPGPKQLELIAAQEPVAIFANLLASDPINLVLRKEVAERLNVSPTASLKEKLESLKGLKIGVAPGPVTRLRVLFESAGLVADEYVEISLVGGGSQNRMFGEGEVDALYAHTPYLETALVPQGAVELIDQAGGEVPELTGRQHHAMLATREYIEKNPQKVEKLTRAIYRAQQLAHFDIDGAVDALLKSGAEGLEEDLVRTIVGIYAPALPLTPEVSADAILFQLRLFPNHREAPDLAGIDLSLFVAPQFAEKVVAE